jgi:hypothetical protein
MSATTSSASPTGTLIGGYGYVGCQTDAGANTRTLSSTSFTHTAMTVEICSSFCGARGYTYFGVEYGRWRSLNSHFLSQILGNFYSLDISEERTPETLFRSLFSP